MGTQQQQQETDRASGHERLERLERMNSRLLWGMVACFLLAIGGFATGTIAMSASTQSTIPFIHDVLRARSVYIVGDDGANIIQMGTGGGSLGLKY